MSYQYLKSREHYEELYDQGTVERCRSGERVVNDSFREVAKKAGPKALEERKPGWYLLYSQTYFGLVETPAAARAVRREQTINEWMERNEQKERRLANAHLAKTPYCRVCGKDMELINRDYMHRESNASAERDDILLMFECVPCNKRVAYWEDGTEWEGHKTYCEKCKGEMKSTHKKHMGVITMIYTCPKCGHSYDYVLDLNKDDPVTKEPADPFYELDRKRFIFDSDMMFKYEQKGQHLQRLLKLEATIADQAVYTDIYEAIKDIKKLKVAQLTEILKPVLEKAGYTEFKLDQPEIGREVAVGFSCLDAKPEREEYNSKKELQKLIAKKLDDTNWRLMSEGVSYRVGYLTGRLRAYESEEELRKLVEQKAKHGMLTPPATPKPSEQPSILDHPPRTLSPRERNMRESCLVYFHKMTLDSVPAEITLKSGRKKSTSISFLRMEMNPLLRVIIPMRDSDDSVPEFVRNFDFKIGKGDGEIPQVSKDSLGREIRRV